MTSVRSYQDIKTPEEIEEDQEMESALESMAEEFDPEEAAANHCSFRQYMNNCRRNLKRR